MQSFAEKCSTVTAAKLPAKGPLVKKRPVSTLFGALQNLGLFALAGRTRYRRRSLLILCYHGVSLADEHDWRPDLYISPAHLRQHLKCLHDARASVLPLDEALSRLRAGSLPPKSVTITFDDGFYDFSQQALPLLVEFGFPSTVYLTTHYSNYRLPIHQLMLDYVFWKSRRKAVLVPQYGISTPQQISDPDTRLEAAQQVSKWMSNQMLDTKGRDEVVRGIAQKFEIDYEAFLQSRLLQIMSPVEVRCVARYGVDIQLHTHRHRMPSDRTLFKKEIDDNRRQILEYVGKNPVHFCYPSGRCSGLYANWLAEFGVRSATTCMQGLARATSDPLLLPRVMDNSLVSDARFCAAVNGVVI